MDNQVIVQGGSKPGLLLVLVSWLFLFLLTALSSIPFLGLASWLVAIPVLLMTFVFSIIILSNGRTVNGIFLLVSTVVLVPLYIAFAPLVATAVASYMMTGECEITITDSQGNLVKKKADLKHLTFSDWKTVEQGKKHSQQDNQQQSGISAPAAKAVESSSSEKEEPGGKETTPSTPPQEADKKVQENEEQAPAPVQEKLEYI